MNTTVVIFIVVGVLLFLGIILFYRKQSNDFIGIVDKNLDTFSQESLERKLKSYREIAKDERKSPSTRRDAKRMIRLIEEKINHKND